MSQDRTIREISHEIFLFEKLLDQELCRQIIQIAELSTFSPAAVALTQIETQVRSNDDLHLEGNPLLDSTNNLLLQKVGIVQQWLFQYYGIRFPHAETCTILRYQPGQFYKRHVDNMILNTRLEEAASGIPIRDVSIVGYLNEDCEGGETFFDRQNLTLKPDQGSVLVFPASFIYPHQALPVKAGVKYVFVTWLFH